MSKAQTDELKHRIGATPMSVLTQALLSEKNNEIDELTSEIERLNTELQELRQSSRPEEVRFFICLRQSSRPEEVRFFLCLS